MPRLLFERLLPERGASVQQLVRANLERIFNSRDEHMAFSGGLPYIGGLEGASSDQLERLRSAIAGAVKQWEPRLVDVAVRVVDRRTDGSRPHMQISARLDEAPDGDFDFIIAVDQMLV